MKANWSSKFFSAALILMLALAFMPLAPAHAATVYNSTATGNWTDAIWDQPGTPGAGDTVTIKTGHTVTITSLDNIQIDSITIESGAVLINNGTLTITSTLTGGGTFTQGTNAVLNLNMGGGTSLNVTTFDVSTNFNTVNYIGGAQTIRAVTYRNLGLGGSGAKTLTGLTTINGDLNLTTTTPGTTTTTAGTLAALTIGGNLNVGSSTSFTVANTYTINVTGTTTVSGTLTNTGTGAKTYTGNITINNGGVWTETTNPTINIGGSLQNNGTFTAGTTAHTFSGAGATFSGTNAISIPTIAITGSYTNNGTLSATTTLTGAGSLTQGGGAILNLGGTTTITTLDAATNVNTVNYNGAGQTVKAVAYHHLTLSGSGAKTLTSLTTINGDLTLSGTATASTAANLTVGGNLSVGSGTSFTVANTFTVNVTGTTTVAGTLGNTGTGTKTYTGNVTINSGGTWTETTNPTISFSGNVYNNGSMTTLTGTHTFNNIGNGVIQGANATLSDSGTTLTIVSASAAGNTVTFNGAAQTIPALTYSNLTLGGSGTKTLQTGMTINGNFSIGVTSGIINTVEPMTIGGNLSLSAGTFTIGHALVINGSTTVSGGTWSNSTAAVSFRGNLTLSGGTFTAGTAAYTFETNNAAFSGTATFANLIINGVTLTNNGTITVNTQLVDGASPGTLMQGATGSLTLGMVGSSFTLTTLDASATGNTVTYNFNGAQTVRAISYHHLIVTGSASHTVTFAATTVNGNLTIQGTATATTLPNGLAVGGNLVIGNTATVTLGGNVSVAGNVTLNATACTLNINSNTISVGGNWLKNTTATFSDTGSAGTIVFNGSAAQTVNNGTVAINNVTINNSSSGVSLLTNSLTVNNTLTLTNGVLTTGALNVILPSAGTISGGNATSYVVGNIKKFFPSGNQSFTFTLGDATGYRPLTLSNFNVTSLPSTTTFIIGSISAAAEHATAGAGIDQAYDVNYYWTLSTSGSTITYTNYDVTLGFTSNHYDAGANPLVFVVRRCENGTTWSAPTLGTIASTSAQATGLSSLGTTSDFVVGERPRMTLAVSPVTDTYGSITTALTATLTTTAGGTPYGSATVNFTLDGNSVGSAITNGSGVATFNLPLLKENYGTHTGGIVADFAGDYDHGITTGNNDLTVNKKPITVTATTDTKTYDGTTASSAIPTITSGGPLLVSGDTVTWTQVFDSRNFGSRTLTPSGTVNDGNGGNNYSVSFVTTSGIINKKTITVNAVSASKTYDGTKASSTTPSIAPGLGSGDSSGFIQTYASDNVGTWTLTPSGAVNDGNSGNNYSVTFGTGVTGAITKRAVTVTAVTQTKVYDGTTNSSGVPTITSGSLASGDTVTWTQSFSSKDVGTRTLTPAGTINDGNSGNNYNVTKTPVNGSITKKTLTVTAQNQTLTSTIPAYTYTTTGFISGESLTVVDTKPTCSVIAGSYPPRTTAYAGVIRCSGGLDNDYTFAYVNGSLTVKLQTTTYVSQSANDGWVLESKETSNTGGSVDTAGFLQIGDDSSKRQYLSILSFATGSVLPDSKLVISNATLTLFYNGISGSYPSPAGILSSFQGFYADIKKGTFGTAALTTADFQTAGDKTIGPVSPTMPTLKDKPFTLNLTAGNTFFNNLATNSGLTQIKLRFKQDDNNNTIADFLKIYSANWATASLRPVLTLQYYRTP